MRQLCLEPRCPDPPSYRGRCAAHSRQRNRETRSDNKLVYNRAKWQNTRRLKLHLDPTCQRCGNQLATDVHHIVALQDGGDPWSMDNLESLCHGCHSRETRREQLEATP